MQINYLRKSMILHCQLKPGKECTLRKISMGVCARFPKPTLSLWFFPNVLMTLSKVCLEPDPWINTLRRFLYLFRPILKGIVTRFCWWSYRLWWESIFFLKHTEFKTTFPKTIPYFRQKWPKKPYPLVLDIPIWLIYRGVLALGNWKNVNMRSIPWVCEQ